FCFRTKPRPSTPPRDHRTTSVPPRQKRVRFWQKPSKGISLSLRIRDVESIALGQTKQTKRKDTNMKTIRIPLMVATALAALAFTTAANAQYNPIDGDGIAASPKVRQMLNERKASAVPAVAVTPAMACPK